MQADNIPTINAAGEGLPPPTWQVLWDTLKPHPASVAKALMKEHGEVAWEVALKVSVEASEDPASTAAEQKRRLGTFADSPSPLYFLTVLDGKMQVLYGWRTCRALDQEGKTWTGLIGDRRVSASGTEILPRLFRAGSTANDQYKVFGKVSAKPPTMADIQAAFAADNAPALVAPLGGEGEMVTVWGVLPVHPKVASIFMHSPTVKEAADIYTHLYQLVPEGGKAGLDPIASFVRVATVEEDGSSALEKDWRRVSLQDDDALEFWHAEACGAHHRP